MDNYKSYKNKMKVVILAGGFGTRISEESHMKPKPMIEIGGKPILLHIMEIYSKYGFKDFIICAGYKQEMIKSYFSQYGLYESDLRVNLATNELTYLNSSHKDWTITIVNTGLETMTGGRVKAISHLIDDENFLLTYGDGVSDVDLDAVINLHIKNRPTVTLTAIQPGGRYGKLGFQGTNNISSFEEKRKEDGGWINGGFMVVNKKIFEIIEGSHTVLEQEPLKKLAESSQLVAYKHHGFWQSMDTLRDKISLEELISKNEAPWI